MEHEFALSLQWLFPVIFTVHNLEEAIYLPDWSKNAGKFYKPVGKFEFRFAVIFLTLLSYLVTYFSFNNGPGTIYFNIFCGFNAAIFLNVFFPHLVSALYTKEYAPGMYTALIFNLPVTLFFLYSFIKYDLVSVADLLIYSGIVLVVLVSLIPLLFYIGRKLDKATE